MNPIAAGLLIAMSVPSLHSAQGAGEASETDIVDTAKDSGNRLTVPVRLGDHGPFRFLVDTGSQNTVVANSLVSRLALVPKSRARLVGVAGMQVVDTVEIEEVMLGRRSYYGILAPILDRKDIGAEGILGIDSLQDQRILLGMREMRVFPRIAIDFKAHKVLFDLPDAGDPAYFGLPPEAQASPQGE